MRSTVRQCDECRTIIEEPEHPRVQRNHWALRGPGALSFDFCSTSCIGSWAAKQ